MILNLDENETNILRRYQRLVIFQKENEYVSVRESLAILLKELDPEIAIEEKKHSLIEFKKAEALQQEYILLETRNDR